MDMIWLDSNPHSNPDEFSDEHRKTNYHIETVDEYNDPASANLRITFSRFGRGEKRRPSFAVEMNWIDVKSFIRAYIELGHPEAIYLQRLILLAETIERAGWSPDDPPLEEFRDILPPQSN